MRQALGELRPLLLVHPAQPQIDPARQILARTFADPRRSHRAAFGPLPFRSGLEQSLPLAHEIFHFLQPPLLAGVIRQ